MMMEHTSLPNKMNPTSRITCTLTLSNLLHNIHELKQYIQPNTKVMAVMKANAYGHNAIEVATYLQENGISIFAVATIQEAIELREHGITINILNLGCCFPSDLPIIHQYHIIQTITNTSILKEMDKSNLTYEIAIAIDTGMHRIGFPANKINEIKSCFYYPNIHVKHIYSHLCDVERNDSKAQKKTIQQISSFDTVLKQLPKGEYTTSLQASYGILNQPQLQYDYVRLGISLYGVTSENHAYQKNLVSLKPVLELHSKIVDLHEVDENETIGYGQTYCCQRKSKIATLSIGYGDGLFRNYDDLYVYYQGKAIPVVGRICMDYCMIDCTEINVQLFDEVEWIGEHQSAATLAQAFHTNSNELLTRLHIRGQTILKR